MFSRIKFLISCPALLLFFIPCHSQEYRPFPGFDNYVNKIMSEWQVPAMAIAVVRDDRIIFEKGYGVRTLGRPEKVDPNTIFGIASMTKAFTAASIGILVAERRLSLDDKVKKYIPYFRLYDTCATHEADVEDLMCHRIGVGTFAGDLLNVYSDYSRQELIRKMHFIRPSFPFREGFGYCNVAFLTAGQIIPVATDTSWDDFVKYNILQPLQMNRTFTSYKPLADLDNVATPYVRSGDSLIAISYGDVDNCGPAGSINSCVHDLAHWMMEQLDPAHGYNGKTVIPPLAIRLTHVPHNIIFPNNKNPLPDSVTHFVGYGLGWFIRDYHGQWMYYHSGGLDGVHSLITLLPGLHTGIVILTSFGDSAIPEALTNEIAEHALGLPFHDYSAEWLKRFEKQNREKDSTFEARLAALKAVRRNIRLPEQAYMGEYINAHYGRSSIIFANGQLRLYLSHHPGVYGTLSRLNPEAFLCTWNSPHPLGGPTILLFTLEDKRVKDYTLTVDPELDPGKYVFEKELTAQRQRKE